MSTGDGFGHRWGRNGEFCKTVGLVTRTAGILTDLIESNPGRLKGIAMSYLAMDLMVYASIFSLSYRYGEHIR